MIGNHTFSIETEQYFIFFDNLINHGIITIISHYFNLLLYTKQMAKQWEYIIVSYSIIHIQFSKYNSE